MFFCINTKKNIIGKREDTHRDLALAPAEGGDELVLGAAEGLVDAVQHEPLPLLKDLLQTRESDSYLVGGSPTDERIEPLFGGRISYRQENQIFIW